MTTIRMLARTLFVLGLCGCETSAVWYHSHPERRTVAIDGVEVSVVPRRANEFDALGGDDGAATNTAVLKTRQIQAIEQVSRCKVVAAEYMAGSWILQSVVNCGNPAK